MFRTIQESGPVRYAPSGRVKGLKKTTLTGGGGATVLRAFPVKSGRLVYIEAIVSAIDTAGVTGLFIVKAAARNVAGTTSLLGTPNVLQLRDGSTVNVTVTANDTNDTIEVKGTPAAADTDFNGKVSITDMSSKLS